MDQIEELVALEGRRDLCGATDQEIDRTLPVAELITIRVIGKGRVEQFACLAGYVPPEGHEVIERKPLYLHP